MDIAGLYGTWDWVFNHAQIFVAEVTNIEDRHSLAKWLLTVAGSSFATKISSKFFEDRAQSLVATVFGGIPIGSKRAQGIWFSEYEYMEHQSAERKRSEHIVVLRQLGNKVSGYSLKKGEGSRLSFVMIADKRNLLTGRWIERTSRGHLYYGAIQMQFSGNETELDGRWLGFNNKMDILDGSWKLTLLDRKTSRAKKKAAIYRHKLR